ncbi:MAG: hypothetical protein M0C28_15565 [Candidatus Moduliflexus flocculans]|nr:hypothetical protein [Candidatus Moduliflexus flocculans]
MSYVNGSVYVQRTGDLGYEKGEVNLALVQGDKMGTEVRPGRDPLRPPELPSASPTTPRSSSPSCPRRGTSSSRSTSPRAAPTSG